MDLDPAEGRVAGQDVRGVLFHHLAEKSEAVQRILNLMGDPGGESGQLAESFFFLAFARGFLGPGQGSPMHPINPAEEKKAHGAQGAEKKEGASP